MSHSIWLLFSPNRAERTNHFWLCIRAFVVAHRKPIHIHELNNSRAFRRFDSNWNWRENEQPERGRNSLVRISNSLCSENGIDFRPFVFFQPSVSPIAHRTKWYIRSATIEFHIPFRDLLGGTETSHTKTALQNLIFFSLSFTISSLGRCRSLVPIASHQIMIILFVPAKQTRRANVPQILQIRAAIRCFRLAQRRTDNPNDEVSRNIDTNAIPLRLTVFHFVLSHFACNGRAQLGMALKLIQY